MRGKNEEEMEEGSMWQSLIPPSSCSLCHSSSWCPSCFPSHSPNYTVMLLFSNMPPVSHPLISLSSSSSHLHFLSVTANPPTITDCIQSITSQCGALFLYSATSLVTLHPSCVMIPGSCAHFPFCFMLCHIQIQQPLHDPSTIKSQTLHSFT